MKMMAGAAPLACSEEVAHARCSHADKHLHEIGTRKTVEGDARLSRHRLGQQGLAGAGRADQQYPFGYLGSQGLELLRVLQELLDLLQLLDRFVQAGHVLESDLGMVPGGHLGAALAEGHDLVAAPLHPLEHEDEDDEDEDERQQPNQDA